MTITRNLILAGIIGVASFTVAPAYALSAKECSTKYQAAKDAGTLGGLKWNDFRKAQCADATPAAAAPAAPTKPAAKTTAAAPKAAAPADSGGGLTMKECSAKYQAAKTAGTLGGQKWNDFRKAQCSDGAAAAAPAATPTKAAKTATAPADTGAAAGGLTMKECSAKYQAAKAAGTLGGQKWNDFRKAQCSSGATAAADDTAPAPETATYKDEPPAATTAAPAGVAFPRAISAKYSTESAGKARMHTCLEQYYANKQSNTLGGLKWIQKGGGYYSLCNTRLKS
ncbi:hypothetical protein HB779_16345 [Phyllobacterium sp. 628]|uniref:hypothetical protein n=1 Tax=Phyllobacterium sp. 628 TaxID=2718938 RepID=UPI0016627B83|nr:hypothetical protein [Phyllobacterium sp. 628]QND53287.1 hypothetical protein HB779_16345 [Phyllobacterium sp. 628]